MALVLAHAIGPAVGSPDCGTVVVPIGVGPSSPAPASTMHPVLSANSTPEQEMYRLLFRPVVLPNADRGVDWSTSLASSIEVGDGGATYRVTIKPYQWSDGEPVTADDVLYCWELIHKLGTTFSNYGTGGIPTLIRSLTVTGPNSFEIRLLRAVNPDWFETNGISLLYPLPRHSWGRLTVEQQQTLQGETSFYQVVDGAFRLERLVSGRYASFVPNDRFGGHHATLRRLVVTFQPGGDPLEELRSGQIDMVNLPFPVWDAAQSLPGFDAVTVGPDSGVNVILPNLHSPTAPFLADLRVRQAIATAIDQRKIVEVEFHGRALPNQGFVPSGSAALLSASIRRGQSPLAFDPARAAALLDAAGWRVGIDGMRRKNGQTLSFEVLTTAGLPTGVITLQLVKSDLERVGIDLRIKEAEFSQILARAVGPPSGWQALFFGQPTEGFPDAGQFFRTGSGNNFGRYSSPEMDRLIDASIDDPGLDGLFTLQDYVRAQQPEFFLPSGAEIVLVRPGIGGLGRFISPNGTWLPEYLTLSGPLACH